VRAILSDREELVVLQLSQPFELNEVTNLFSARALLRDLPCYIIYYALLDRERVLLQITLFSLFDVPSPHYIRPTITQLSLLESK